MYISRSYNKGKKEQIFIYKIWSYLEYIFKMICFLEGTSMPAGPFEKPEGTFYLQPPLTPHDFDVSNIINLDTCCK